MVDRMDNDELARLKVIGRSPAFVAAMDLVRRFAASDATVLIQGETGTGKELAARAVHYLSRRAEAPFVPVNCGAIPETLVENELFGHTRGAFTDAKEARQGVIAQARGGTLFLDEIDALSAHAQVALLRFLQDQEYCPVGGSVVRDANVRIVASSNADLACLVSRGAFRQDLLYRLNVLSVCMPPLRERSGDAGLLAEAFVRQLSRQYATGTKSLHPDTIAFVDSHSWPGNVRELENFIHREFVLADGPIIRLRQSTAGAQGGSRPGVAMTDAGFREAKARAVEAFERAYIMELLGRTHGNISEAARLAGKERSRLGKLVKKYGLERRTFSMDP
jgi:DNA-binding NtrC family response regulator